MVVTRKYLFLRTNDIFSSLEFWHHALIKGLWCELIAIIISFDGQVCQEYFGPKTWRDVVLMYVQQCTVNWVYGKTCRLTGQDGILGHYLVVNLPTGSSLLLIFGFLYWFKFIFQKQSIVLCQIIDSVQQRIMVGHPVDIGIEGIKGPKLHHWLQTF